LQLADALQAPVADGTLKAGERLPPQRLLAAQLKLDLTKVTCACDEARRRNLLEGRGARGTYVAAPKVALYAMLDLSMNTPPAPHGVDFGEQEGHHGHTSASIWREGTNRLVYGGLTDLKALYFPLE
jgi:DNA-binding transcriptional MocR family regulator